MKYYKNFLKNLDGITRHFFNHYAPLKNDFLIVSVVCIFERFIHTINKWKLYHWKKRLEK